MVAALMSVVGNVAPDDNSRKQAAAVERIKPVARVSFEQPKPVVVANLSGLDVYNKVCAACHATGTLGAPKTGAKDQWEPRFAQGLDTLVTHSVNGLRAMPAKGGAPSMTEANMKDAIIYMLGESGIKVQNTAAPAPAAAPTAAAPAPAAAPAVPPVAAPPAAKQVIPPPPIATPPATPPAFINKTSASAAPAAVPPAAKQVIPPPPIATPPATPPAVIKSSPSAAAPNSANHSPRLAIAPSSANATMGLVPPSMQNFSASPPVFLQNTLTASGATMAIPPPPIQRAPSAGLAFSEAPAPMTEAVTTVPLFPPIQVSSVDPPPFLANISLRPPPPIQRQVVFPPTFVQNAFVIPPPPIQPYITSPSACL